MPPEVLAAFQEAARGYVWLPALQEATGRRVAEVVGAPAALLTSGAAGAILLAVAGCLTGTDRERTLRLPRLPPGTPDEVLVWRMPRPNYLYQPVEAAGGTLVEVGDPAGPLSAADFKRALGPRPAAVLLMIHTLDEGRHLTGGWEDLIGGVCRAVAGSGARVLVDAAAELPPRALVRRLLDLGVDGVMLSGGTAIRGPQSSGLLLGQTDLIAAAGANNAPEQRIGRPLKVGKEELCALTVAVERFFSLDEGALLGEWREACQTIAAGAQGRGGAGRGVKPAGRGGATARVVEGIPGYGRPPLVPKAVVTPGGGAAGATALQERLRAGSPAGQTMRRGAQGADGAEVLFNPMTLQPGEAELIAARLRRALE
jgi:seryl-tRNA(Sec) selenium transferase